AKGITEVKAQEKPLPRELLNELGGGSLGKVFSTLSAMGILPKPQEFQRIVLVNVGKRDLADQLDDQNRCFDPCSSTEPTDAHTKLLGLNSGNFDSNIMNMLSQFMPDRSY